MITNTPEYTEPLSPDEIEMAGIIWRTLKQNHTNKSSSATGSRIVKGLRGRGFKCNGVRVRKMINYLRNNGCAIVSNSNGYWATSDQAEIKIQIESLQQRIGAIQSAINGLSKNIK